MTTSAKPRRFSVVPTWDTERTRQEVAEMHARAYFQHDNFHKTGEEVIATEEAKGYSYPIYTTVRVTPIIEFTFEENATA